MLKPSFGTVVTLLFFIESAICNPINPFSEMKQRASHVLTNRSDSFSSFYYEDRIVTSRGELLINRTSAKIGDFETGLTLFNLASGAKEYLGSYRSGEFGPDRKTLLAVTEDGKHQVIDLDKRTVLFELSTPVGGPNHSLDDNISGIDVSADLKHVLVVRWTKAQLVDLHTGKVLAELPFSASETAKYHGRLSADGTKAIFAYNESLFENLNPKRVAPIFWDISKKTSVRASFKSATSRAIVFDQDSNLVAVTGLNDGNTYLWNLKNNKARKIKYSSLSAEFSLDNSYILLSRNAGQSPVIVDVTTGKAVQQFPANTSDINWAHFIAGTNDVVTIVGDIVHIWSSK